METKYDVYKEFRLLPSNESKVQYLKTNRETLIKKYNIEVDKLITVWSNPNTKPNGYKVIKTSSFI